MKILVLTLLSILVIGSSATAQEKVENKETQQKKEVEKRKERKKRKAKPVPGSWHMLKNISEEERNRLRTLYETDPKTFRQELAKIIKRLRAEKDSLNQKVKELVKQYKTSKDPKKKKAALKELREITSKIFYTKMEHNKKRLESLEKQVKNLRSQYDFRQKNADKIIQARLDALLGNTNFEWDD
jgi:uncharacterized phage infection (PIP) family protein YhgE